LGVALGQPEARLEGREAEGKIHAGADEETAVRDRQVELIEDFGVAFLVGVTGGRAREPEQEGLVGLDGRPGSGLGLGYGLVEESGDLLFEEAFVPGAIALVGEADPAAPVRYDREGRVS
jgi:hypothetical protein